MSKAELRDIETLTRFIANLKTFNAELDARSQRLNSHWGSLQRVWRDRQCEKFAADWESSLAVIRKYLDGSSAYVSHLEKKRDQAETYGQ
jgi:hypothetical protein